MSQKNGDPLLLFVSGKIGSGKTAVCEYLVKEHGFVLLNFADRIKEVVATLTNTRLKDQYSRRGKRMTLKGGEGMKALGTLGSMQQKVGTALRESIHPNIWIFLCWRQVQIERKGGSQRILIGDTRMKREAVFLETKGFRGIRVERPRVDRLEYIQGREENHITETDLDDHEFTVRVHNTSSLQNLLNSVEEFVNKQK